MSEDCTEFKPQELQYSCCNESFSLDIFPSGSTDWYFYATQDGAIVVTYVYNGHLYMAVSYDCGKTFTNTMQLMKIEGQIKKFNILAKGDQFVISVLEKNGGANQEIKKAVSGWFTRDNNSFTHKECVKYTPQPDETIINVSLGFRISSTVENAIESVDYVFVKRGNIVSILCQGHPCVV
jgi:hypothetical protein